MFLLAPSCINALLGATLAAAAVSTHGAIGSTEGTAFDADCSQQPTASQVLSTGPLLNSLLTRPKDTQHAVNDLYRSSPIGYFRRKLKPRGTVNINAATNIATTAKRLDHSSAQQLLEQRLNEPQAVGREDEQ
jgi:hypothetical protein